MVWEQHQKDVCLSLRPPEPPPALALQLFHSGQTPWLNIDQRKKATMSPVVGLPGDSPPVGSSGGLSLVGGSCRSPKCRGTDTDLGCSLVAHVQQRRSQDLGWWPRFTRGPGPACATPQPCSSSCCVLCRVPRPDLQPMPRSPAGTALPDLAGGCVGRGHWQQHHHAGNS